MNQHQIELAQRVFEKATELNPTFIIPEIPLFMTAQACHESNYFTSEIFLKSNNCFGMRPAVIRPKCQSGAIYTKSGKYASYKSIEESVEDFDKWLIYVKFFATVKVFTPDVYALNLRLYSYFTDTVANYSNGIKRALKELGSLKVS